MTVRPYLPADFDYVRQWITDARTHAMWCANRLPYPFSCSDFDSFLREHAVLSGDRPYTALSDDGTPVGFFCYTLNSDTGEGMLKFVVVDSERRGRGIGQEMLALAVRKAFENGAEAVQLYVFAQNARAKHCYEKVGFTERRTDTDAFRFRFEKWSRCNMVIRKQEGSEIS